MINHVKEILIQPSILACFHQKQLRRLKELVGSEVQSRNISNPNLRKLLENIIFPATNDAVLLPGATTPAEAAPGKDSGYWVNVQPDSVDRGAKDLSSDRREGQPESKGDPRIHVRRLRPTSGRRVPCLEWVVVRDTESLNVRNSSATSERSAFPAGGPPCIAVDLQQLNESGPPQVCSYASYHHHVLCDMLLGVKWFFIR